jgi:hypothetical protein
MLAMAKHLGSCYCGTVEIEATGDPIDMGYCHCDGCRRYSGAPIAAFTLWKPEQVKITKGADELGKFKSSEMSERRFCTKCGGHVMVDHPTLGLVDIRAGLPAEVAFKPSVHLNYEDTVLGVKDGLPKLKDFPKEIGGSGETIPE